jgi:hypothetical protein
MVRYVCLSTNRYNIVLYTLSYSFDRIEYKTEHWSKSTCPNKANYQLFYHVKIFGSENLFLRSD